MDKSRKPCDSNILSFKCLDFSEKSIMNSLPLVLNAIGVAIGKPLWPFDIGDVEAEMTKYQTKSIYIFSRIEETDNSFEMPIGFIL